MIRLALLRHGHTEWNRTGRIQGRTDVPLDPDAKAHLAKRALPAPWSAAELWSSPLLRARTTAELVAGRMPRVEAALIEMHWGAWEGRQGKALHADPASGFRDIDTWGWSYRPPDGESPADLRNRLTPWAQTLTADAVAVCHIGVMRVLLALATGWDFRGPAPFQIKRDRLYVITLAPSGWQLDPAPIRLPECQP